MPSSEALYDSDVAEDFYPASEDEHSQLVSWAQAAFSAAESHRRQYETRWKRYYKLRRSYFQRTEGDWKSKVFWPMCFWVIETTAPRIVSTLPKPVVLPVSQDDVDAARLMERLIDWALANSGFYVELVKSVKSCLTYGTGIMKSFYDEDTAFGTQHIPIKEPITQMLEQPVFDPDTAMPMSRPDGTPVVEMLEQIMGERTVSFQSEPVEYTVYEGPKAEAIDIFNFWVAPEAESIPGARYTIERMYREMSEIKEKELEGFYRLPEWLSPEDITGDPDQGRLEREGEIEMSSGGGDTTRKPVELLEIWRDDGRVMTVMNGKAIIRYTANPFHHRQKPYVPLIDYLNEHEFWGSGEIEPLEGIQDATNAIANQRIDNIRLVLNQMFGVSLDDLVDQRDLVSRPGGFVRTTGGRPVQEVIMPIQTPDITNAAFVEVDALERAAEKTSGISGYQIGVETPTMNRTATGASLMNEASSSRFFMKNKLIETLGLKPLFRQFASNIQQFTAGERIIRIGGDESGPLWEKFTPESIQGSLDFDVEAMSATQTEAVRKDQAMQMLSTVGTVWPPAVPALTEDLLREFGVKDMQRYGLGPAPAQAAPQVPVENPVDAALAAAPLPTNGEGAMLGAFAEQQ